MLIPCPDCLVALEPCASEPLRKDPTRVILTFACPCGRRWRRAWSRDAVDAWQRAGGRWADPDPEPRDTGITVERVSP